MYTVIKNIHITPSTLPHKLDCLWATLTELFHDSSTPPEAVVYIHLTDLFDAVVPCSIIVASWSCGKIRIDNCTVGRPARWSVSELLPGLINEKNNCAVQ